MSENKLKGNYINIDIKFLKEQCQLLFSTSQRFAIWGFDVLS